jgi:hypothetical protein
MIFAASPVSANQQEPTPASVAPAGGPETRYCLRVDPLTGSHMETIQCRTRYDWAMLDVDVDAEWAQNGVRVIA